MISNNEVVVLIHGMGRGAGSMKKIAQSLKADGYSIVNIAYPSTRQPISDLIKYYIAPKIQNLNYSTIHFVSHSLGGILLRQIFQTKMSVPIGRIVMLSPPNHGSEIVDAYRDRWWFKLLNGPAGQVLGTDNGSLPNQLKPLSHQVGIITGNKSYEPWFSRLIAGDNDGKVSVESAKLTEMTDFLVVNAGHTFIMNKPQVIKQIRYYLIHAMFK